MGVFWLLPMNSTWQNVTGSVLSHVLYIIGYGSMNRVIEDLIAMGGNSDLSFDITHPQNGIASLFQHLTILTLCLWWGTERATKVDILAIPTEHLMSIERLIGDKVSNEQGDRDLVGYALWK
jgi:hypothetical protein